MDTHDKLKEIRNEYKQYLIEKHPEWSENTISTHVSDACYIWNNTVIPGFWKVFVSDESMEAAKESIKDFLKNETKSDKYEERANYYFKDLLMLKEFVLSSYLSDLVSFLRKSLILSLAVSRDSSETNTFQKPGITVLFQM